MVIERNAYHLQMLYDHFIHVLIAVVNGAPLRILIEIEDVHVTKNLWDNSITEEEVRIRDMDGSEIVLQTLRRLRMTGAEVLNGEKEGR